MATTVSSTALVLLPPTIATATHGGAGRERLHALDGLRGLLALYVCLYHLSNTLPPVTAFEQSHAYILQNGWFAVDVFFVMSGFVMTYVYGGTFGRTVRGDDYWKFMMARMGRLYPVHLVTMLILIVALLPFIAGNERFLSEDGRYSWSGVLASLYMAQGPWVDHRTWNYPSWSVSAEWHAYLLFPLFAVVMQRGRIVVPALALGIAIPLAVYLMGLGNEQFPTNGPVVLLRAIPLFIVGIALYRLRDRLGAATAWVAGPVVIGTGVLLSYPASAPFALLLIPVIVLAALHSRWLAWTLCRRPVLYLGAISYSLYMVHAVVEILVLNRVVGLIKRYLAVPEITDLALSATLLAAAVAVSVAAAALLYRYVEVPGRQLVRTMLASGRLPSFAWTGRT